MKGTLKKVNKHLQEYFLISKSEKNAALIFFLISSVMVLIPEIYSKLKKPIKKENSIGPVENTMFNYKKAALINGKSLSQLKSLQTPIKEQTQKNQSINKPKIKFDINTATVNEILKIKINKKIAERIIKYRDILGGYITKKQYEEIYKIKQEERKKLEQTTYIRKNFVPKKISLNTSTFKEMIRHPYLGFEEVKKIFQLRKKKKIEKIEELLENRVISKEKYERIKRYIKT